jgi:hypothetical protein
MIVLLHLVVLLPLLVGSGRKVASAFAWPDFAVSSEEKYMASSLAQNDV